MINDFITMMAAGVFALIVVFAARHALKKATGRVLPKWVMPVCAGLAMLATAVRAEYRWFPDFRAQMPASVVVVQQGAESALWRPWTYLAPIVTRFVALDRAQITRPAPGIAQTDLLLIARWQPLQVVPVAYDCAKGARADLFGGATVNPDGTTSGPAWLPLAADDAGLKAACNGG